MFFTASSKSHPRARARRQSAGTASIFGTAVALGVQAISYREIIAEEV